MTEQNPDHPRPQPTPAAGAEPPGGATLGYRNVGDDAGVRNRRAGWFAAGFFGGLFLALGVSAACFVGLFFFGAAYGRNTGVGYQPADAWAWVCLATVAAAEVGLVVLAVVMHRRRRWTGFLVGTLLGVGLAALPLGLCFAIIGDEAMR